MNQRKFIVQLSKYGKEETPQILVISSLNELIKKGAQKFNLDKDNCEIVTSSGDVVAEDEFLFLIVRKDERVFIQTVNKSISLDSKVQSPQREIASSIVTSIRKNSSVKLKTKQSIQPKIISCQEQHFPVPGILIEARRGIQGVSALTFISHIQSSEVCSEKALFFIRWATATWLIENCKGRNKFPSKKEYLKMAKSIVHFFPMSGFATESHSKPYDLWYNEMTKKGLLLMYEPGNRIRPCLAVPAHTIQKPMYTKETHSEDEILQAEEYMRRTSLDCEDKENNNHNLMLTKMQLTRERRRSFIETGKNIPSSEFLNIYPRLKDMPQAVNEEFAGITKSSIDMFVTNWRKYEKCFLNYAKVYLKPGTIAELLVKKAEEAADICDLKEFTVSITHLLLHMVSDKKIVYKNNESTRDAFPLLFQTFKEAIYPTEAARRAEIAEMKLPGIMELNGLYFVKIDDSAIFLENTKTFEEALAYLVAYYYILHLNFPVSLKFIFGFFERLFEIEPTCESVNGKKMYGFLLCSES